MKTKQKKILVIGSMNMDMVVKTQRIPASGETLLGGVFNQFFGGKGANQAAAARSLFDGVAFCAGAGRDSISKDYLAHLKELKIDTSLVKKFDGVKTGVAVIMVGGKGENSISVAPGANMMLKSADLKKIDFSKYSSVLFQLENRMDTVCAGLKLAKKAGCRTILTPAPACLLPENVLKYIDIIIPNEHEILLLQEGFKDMKSAARALIEKGVGCVIVTLGSEGCLVVNADGEKKYGVYNTKPVDTVGAGDCFTGSLAAGLSLYDGDMDKAVVLATASASLAITKAGAQNYCPRAKVLALAKRKI